MYTLLLMRWTVGKFSVIRISFYNINGGEQKNSNHDIIINLYILQVIYIILYT